MVFCKNQVISLQKAGVLAKAFFLSSRTNPLILIKELKRFREEIQIFNPHIVHAHYGTMTAFFCMISTLKPLVITFRGTDLLPSRSVSWVRNRGGILLSQIAALRAEQIICVSNELKAKLWWKRNQTSVIPSGVDTTIFYPRSKEEARLELGWGKMEKVVLFNLGRDPIHKRLDLAKSSVKIAEGICGEIRLEILDGYVNHVDIPRLMNASDCLLCTSDSEGSPNVVKEALACNLPVISVDVGDVKERLMNVRPSKIVKRDPEEIGKAIAEILKKGERSNGRMTIQELSLENIANRIISVYESIMNNLYKNCLKK
ncbi:MAG: glycosyltransferase family 4 protein [Thermodesulfovibrionales bacterium]